MLERGNRAAPQQPTGETLPQNWAALKSLLLAEVGENNFRSWIQPAAPVSLSGGVLELAVPTRFIRDWLRTHYADRIRLLWTQQFGPVARVDVVVSASAAQPAVPAAPLDVPAPANDMALDQARDGEDFSSPLDPRYTFESFVTGPSNALCAAAARKFADSDTPVYSPLFIHGGVGLGKTHLLQAVASVIRARRPRAKVAYMSAERFMYRFVQSLRGKDTMAFKAFFRNVDVLLIDDLQFICGKESTQEEFLHTFNTLFDQGRQIVIAADRSPAELDGIAERLRSRLGAGLVARIEPASYDLRLEILRSKCRMMKRDIAEDVLELLAEKIVSNVRELEGALTRLVAHAELTGRAVTRDSAQEMLSDVLRAGSRRLSVEDIQKKVAEFYNLRLADILSPRRARPLARPRQVAMYLSKALTEHSLPDIGRRFGGRDHTTIMHGIRRIEELMASDTGLAADVEALQKALAA